MGRRELSSVKEIVDEYELTLIYLSVSMAIFQRQTGESLNHANPPIMMEYPTNGA
jgi:hypothetical protein